MRSYMALITLMVLNALIMAISLSQPNSPHSINETPGLHSIKETPGLHSINETPGLLHSISTQRHTTFRGHPIRHRSDTTQHRLRHEETLCLLLQTKCSHLTLGFLFQTKCSHLTLGFLHRRSAKPILPTATAAPQPLGHGNIFFHSIIIWTLLCIHTDLPILYVLT